MLLGEFHHNIDDKGRLVIPTKFREDLGQEFILTRGIEKCLYVYSKTEWEKLVGKLNTLPFTKKVTRTFTRFFYSGATACEFDKSGRMSITSPLVSYAGLDKECIIIGVNDHLEIWDSKAFEEFMNDNSDIIEDITENLFDGDKNAL
jgi:protein mraZ